MNEKFSSEEIFEQSTHLRKEDLIRAAGLEYHSITLAGQKFFIDTCGLIAIPRRWRLQHRVPKVDIELCKELLASLPKVDRFSVSSQEIVDFIFRLYSIDCGQGGAIVAAKRLGIKQIDARDSGQTMIAVDRRSFTSMRKFVIANGIEIKHRIIPSKKSHGQYRNSPPSFE